MKRKREEGDDQVAEVEDGSPPSLLLSMPDLVHYELMAWLDVASALSVAGTCRKGRALVLHHHKAAQLVVGFLVRHLLSVAARYTSFYERLELSYAAQALARRLPLPNLALDDSGIGPNGQSVGDDCGQENESEEGEEESEDMRIEEEEFKMLLEEGKTYVERPVPPHPRHGLLDMLDAVWVRITARLRQHKIEQEEYWGEYRGFRHPPASELVEITSSAIVLARDVDLGMLWGCSRLLDVASALSVAGTCRKGRALVLRHHKAAQLVVGFLVRHLLSVAARYTSFYERLELSYAAQALARRLPLPNLALDDSGIGPNGQSVGDDCGQENESEEGEEESEDMRIEEEEFKMLLEEGKTYVERPLPPHPRHGLLDMLDAVWVRITARLRQHKIEQEEYWGEYRGFRQPPASELAEIGLVLTIRGRALSLALAHPFFFLGGMSVALCACWRTATSGKAALIIALGVR
ncbi:uncharacterized protein ACA1_250940 [Acanthamoeba castellanii str. Neff]|uniref:F-box domain-containing protein n=1 Tax=Acanthamoeba castellanii (strain ATCC 30010 / Neff) TaxID=1257118 RepID=L8HBZ3_ACACF|nr:uncharacterized protein ACA1_250940 [Acanthamoeba castellanii str. Neff]ELR22253.1 hypothetical protein ACA1_250940 [Acanthamoeba castellanii str. Neff]